MRAIVLVTLAAVWACCLIISLMSGRYRGERWGRESLIERWNIDNHLLNRAPKVVLVERHVCAGVEKDPGRSSDDGHFGVTPDQLKDCVRRVRVMVTDVKKCLAK
jgi:hypothetical protein